MDCNCDERDRALLAAYRRAWEDGALSHREAVERALWMTDRLWVCERHIRRVVRDARRGTGRRGRKARCGLYEAVLDAFWRLRGDSAVPTDSELVRRVLADEVRPGFYLSWRRADRIIRRLKKLGIRN